MIKFKTIKYKHRRQAMAIMSELAGVSADGEVADGEVADGEVADEMLADPRLLALTDDISELAAGLVAEWDFVDVETGEPIPAGELDELSDEQYGELMAAFNATNEDVIVPKPNAATSSSGAKPSKTTKSRAKRRSG